MSDQNKTPIVDTLKNLTQKSHAPFYAPGHKQGKAIPRSLTKLLGKKVFSADLPELPELDNLFAPEGIIQEAQELAAETFGALHTRFLVNGSTTGIIASILATCGNGQKIILPRNIHQSVISGLILSGAMPIFIHPEYNPDWDIPLNITPQSIGQTLAKHPDAKAVMIVYPTYHGICGDIVAIAQEVHKYNIPLLVDEAHGPHFAFHPELPIPALFGGADLTVQSTHKTLGAMTQASMLHIGSNRIDLYRLEQALQILQSSSPSYLLLASLDAARQQMALFGEELMSQTLELAKNARNRISQLSNYSIFDLKGRKKKKEEINLTCLSGDSNLLENEVKEKIEKSGEIFPNSNFSSDNYFHKEFIALDQTRLTIKVSDIGLSGYEADEILHQELGVTCELPSFQNLTFIISLGNTKTDINQLVTGLISLRNKSQINLPNKQKTKLNFEVTDFSIPVSPRDAFFAQKDCLPIEKSVGNISAELIAPYPPGIPVLIPGEIIREKHLQILEKVQTLGGIITGCSDPNLTTIKVSKF
ncbi:aminotransferase class I/II-fold pyridoxal phosphate-dependent enzyme [Okeania sp.]|uniref:aminotransferase class I/II-fold pyridoxal phosphate-dependent enzyme n=1 Tax=Okeania sp. TaxID=3100323 RepID=UPI002B4B3831|nr:aminotransferase class I/II-fold pyridoxal phosphate-dependent enzyme [Okeania sp.]MEB3339251.1 aminotransferase class I/II-fold pyridoxal phosphate-dependent enzyme [Okeania sp.]